MHLEKERQLNHLPYKSSEESKHGSKSETLLKIEKKNH